jgi:prepilin peptidase CpaA
MFVLQDSPALIPVVVSGVVALVAGIIDIRTFKVPNLLTFPLCASGLTYHLIVHGAAGFGQGLAGLLLGLFALSLFYLLGAVGAGDVKLLAGLGAWLGAESTVWVLLLAALASGVCAVVVLGARGRLGTAFMVPRMWVIQLATLAKYMARSERVESVVHYSERRWRLIPFALMLAIGVTIMFVAGRFLG